MTASHSPSLPSGSFPSVWGNVPQRNKNFTGRDDILGLLRARLTESVTAVLPHALQGLAGHIGLPSAAGWSIEGAATATLDALRRNTTDLRGFGSLSWMFGRRLAGMRRR